MCWSKRKKPPWCNLSTILVGVFLIRLVSSTNLVAQDAESVSFLMSESTTSGKAMFAAFLSSFDGGRSGDAAMSVSNVLGPPPNNVGGPLTVVLKDAGGDTIVFSSADHPTTGAGLDENGNLLSGHTWRVFLSEIIRETLGEDRDFIGYAWVVPTFAKASGTYLNILTGLKATGFEPLTPLTLTSIPLAHQYAGKILCTANIPGTSQTTSSVLPGVYRTAVNIHNPHEQTVQIRMKIAVAPPSLVSQFIEKAVAPDALLRVDCQQIINDFGITFIHGAEGFLVVESSHSLDVTAVYTAGKLGGEVVNIDVEQIRERKIN